MTNPFRSLPRVAWLAVCLVPLAFATSASAADIDDQGSFFSETALQQANRQIAELQQKHNIDLRIETFRHVPADKTDAVARMEKGARDKYFVEWMQSRAKATKSTGIFILICKQPGHVEVGISSQLRKRGFGLAERSALRDQLLTSFRSKNYDAGLTGAVGSVVKTASKIKPQAQGAAEHRRPAPAPAPVPQAEKKSPFGSLLIIAVIAIAGIWLLTAIVRAFSGNHGAASPPGGMGGMGMGGGGSMFGSLMTGMFGAMAGHWIYDSFFGGNQAHAQDQFHDGGDFGGSGGDDFQGSGGDFDSDDSGGGDFGGDDFGGGGDFGGDDFGGGDFGGGDFGGGGGDF